jgi:iron complex outermembrane receptor protein
MLNKKVVHGWLKATSMLVCLMVLMLGMNRLHAQDNAGTIRGVLTDPRGQAVQGASVAIASTMQVKRTAVSGADGKFAVSGLAAGSYTVETSATGFTIAVRHGVVVPAGGAVNVSITLTLASVSEEVTVEAEADTSIASQLSPVKALLDAGSARTDITSQYIREFTSAVTDFSDITQAAPGTVSWSTNGIGEGQAKTYYRGFADGNYTMTWDGVPFQDSNDPTHHSWAYVPAPDSDATRAQIAARGDNFLLDSNVYNADGSYNALYYRYYTYHVPTNFEVVTFTLTCVNVIQ